MRIAAGSPTCKVTPGRGRLRHRSPRAEPPALRGPCSRRPGTIDDKFPRTQAASRRGHRPQSPENLKVAVFGTGGISHQVAGVHAGLINRNFDRMSLDAIEHDPEQLAALTREAYIREAGSEGIELIMWLIMRGALERRIRRAYAAYVPASNTAARWCCSRT